jgi:hypothetical protein
MISRHVFSQFIYFLDIIWPTAIATLLLLAADQLFAQVVSSITAVKIPYNGRIIGLASISIISVVAWTFIQTLFQLVFPCCTRKFVVVEWLKRLQEKDEGKTDGETTKIGNNFCAKYFLIPKMTISCLAYTAYAQSKFTLFPHKAKI